MQSMDDDIRAELRQLRARAYGPSADIAQDPAALRRLHELEALVDVPTPDVVTASRPAEVAAPASAEPQSSAPVAAPPVPTGPLAPDRPRRAAPRPLSVRLLLLWGATVVVTALLAGGATYGFAKITPVAVSHGAPQIATLEPTSSVKLPRGWFGLGPSSMVWEFEGLVIFETGASAIGFTSGTDCLMAVAASDVPDPEETDTGGWSASNPYSGCGVGAFPAMFSFVVNSGSPQQLRAKYPDDALQFVQDGERIGVFLDAR